MYRMYQIKEEDGWSNVVLNAYQLEAIQEVAPHTEYREVAQIIGFGRYLPIKYIYMSVFAIVAIATVIKYMI